MRILIGIWLAAFVGGLIVFVNSAIDAGLQCVGGLVIAFVLVSAWISFIFLSSLSEADKEDTIAEALSNAGRDGRPRNFYLTDGSIYSGQIYHGPGTGGATGISQHNVTRVEYPEG